MNDGSNWEALGATPAATDADTRRHLIECLARWVNNLPSTESRREFLISFAKGKKPQALAELKAELIKQRRLSHESDLG